jgi:3-dehydroquinate synthase
MARTVTVHLPAERDRSYPIVIQEGLLAGLPLHLARRYPEREFFVIADSTVARLYGRSLLAGLVRAGVKATLVDFPAGEASKSTRQVSRLTDALLGAKIRRDALLLALGGGVTGDLAGYVAATILRGVTFLQLPTTLLAQVDSSVGGKVGVDHPLGKNLIGAIHQPVAVFIDPGALRTLPVRHVRSGLAEVVKIAVALDGAFFRLLESRGPTLRRERPRAFVAVIARAVALKAAVVARDEREAGLRKVLNLGHTIGHAVEAASGYRLMHGEAVAVGMAVEAWISREMGILGERDHARIVRLLARLGLPVRVPQGIAHRRFVSLLNADKKAERGAVRFVLPRRIGESVIGIDVPAELIDRAMQSRRSP